jgi:hypothetical protein
VDIDAAGVPGIRAIAWVAPRTAHLVVDGRIVDCARARDELLAAMR